MPQLVVIATVGKPTLWEVIMSEHYIHTVSGYQMFRSSAKSWEAVVRYAKRLAGGETIISVDGYIVY